MSMNYSLIILEIAVVGLGLGLLLADLWMPAGLKGRLGYVAAAGVGLILAGSFALHVSEPQFAFGEMYILDGLALFFKRFFLLAALIVLLMSNEFATGSRAAFPSFTRSSYSRCRG